MYRFGVQIVKTICIKKDFNARLQAALQLSIRLSKVK